MGGGGGVMAASSLMAHTSLFDKSNLEVAKARLAMSKCTCHLVKCTFHLACGLCAAHAYHLSHIHVALGFITLL